VTVNDAQAAQVNTEPVNNAQAVRVRRARRESAADQKAATVGRMRVAGSSLRDISRVTGWPLSTCFKAYERWRKANVRAGTEDTRDLLLDRLEDMWLRLNEKLRRGDVGAARAGVEIIELIADLSGAMPSDKHELNVTGIPTVRITELGFGVRPYVSEGCPCRACVQNTALAAHDPSLQLHVLRELEPWDEPKRLEEGLTGDATDGPGAQLPEEVQDGAS